MSEAARPAHAGQWMPTRPMGTIAALASAVAVTIVAAIVLVQFSWSPLQRFYLSAYAKATIGQAIGLPAKPYTQILMTGKQDPTRQYFAAQGDIAAIEAAGDGWAPELSDTARQDGMTRAFAQVSRVPQDRMQALLARNIYREQGLLRLAQVPLVTGALALALFLVWGIRVDFRRSRERRRGARLRGTELLSSMATFNDHVAGRS